MSDIVVLIAKDAAGVAALAEERNYSIIGDIKEFESLTSDFPPPLFPPYFNPALPNVQVTQEGAVALATA